MELAQTMFKNADLIIINTCRLWLQVVTLADIITLDGKTITRSYYLGHNGDNIGWWSNYNWLTQGPLLRAHWRMWCLFLDKIIGNLGTWNQPLGQWYPEIEGFYLTSCTNFFFLDTVSFFANDDCPTLSIKFALGDLSHKNLGNSFSAIVNCFEVDKTEACRGTQPFSWAEMKHTMGNIMESPDHSWSLSGFVVQQIWSQSWEQ